MKKNKSDLKRTLLYNTPFSIIGTFFYYSVLMVSSIFLGRLAGPAEYGQYAILLSISTILVVPMLLSNHTALALYISKNKNKRIQNEYTLAGLINVLVFSVVFGLIIFIIFSLFDFFDFDSKFITFLLLMTFFLVIKQFTNGYIQGKKLFKYQAGIFVLEGIIVAVVFAILFFVFNQISYTSYLISLIAGYIFCISFFLRRLLKNISKKYIFSRSKQLFFAGIFASIGSVNAIFLNSADKLIAKSYFTETEIGIYSAYFVASIAIFYQLALSIVNVFFPHVTSEKDKWGIQKKVTKMFILAFIPGWLVTYLMIWIIMKLFGQAYVTDYWVIAILSTLSLVILYVNMIWWLIASKGKKGFLFTGLHAFISGLIFISLCVLFHNILSIRLVFIFMLISKIYNIIIGNIHLYATRKKTNK